MSIWQVEPHDDDELLSIVQDMLSGRHPFPCEDILTPLPGGVPEASGGGDPMAFTGLHLDFIEKAGTSRGREEFASQHGPLTEFYFFYAAQALPRRTSQAALAEWLCTVDRSDLFRLGESAGKWDYEHATLRATRALLRGPGDTFLQYATVEEARRLLTDRSPGVIRPGTGDAFGSIPIGDDFASFRDLMLSNLKRAGRVPTEREIERAFGIAVINQKLGDHALPRISDDGTQIEFQPEDLLGALWAHLTLELTGHIAIRRCICGKWFYPRTRKQTHHDEKCRSRTYRAALASKQQDP